MKLAAMTTAVAKQNEKRRPNRSASRVLDCCPIMANTLVWDSVNLVCVFIVLCSHSATPGGHVAGIE